MLTTTTVTLSYMASTKTPTYDLRTRAREVIGELVRRDFAGNQSRAAAAWKVRQATISNALNPRKPAAIGPKLFEAVVAHDRLAAARILGIDPGALTPAAEAAMAILASEGTSERIAQWAARTASEVAPEMPGTLHAARLIASLAATVSGPGVASGPGVLPKALPPHRTATRQPR